VQKIYEIYHWEDTTQYDHRTGEGGLFASYINTFLQFTTPEDAKQYVERYFDKEGIKLEWSKIIKNPGLTALAELCLNSFWGKFGQRLNLRQSNFIHDSEAENVFSVFVGFHEGNL